MSRLFPTTITVCVLLFASLIAHAAGDTLTIGGVTIKPSSRTDLRINIPAGRSDPATFIPVTVLAGAKPGPTVLLVAGVHGFEFTSVLAAEQLATSIAPSALSGNLILVRVAHIPAFEARVPYVNPFDRKNLNRSFPGAADGSQTERIAHALSTKLIAEADFVIDAHSGDGAEWLASFVGVFGGPLASDYPKALGVAHAIGLPNIVRYSMHTQQQVDSRRSLNRQAVAEGLPTVIVEIGENGQRDPANVRMMVDGIRSALAFLSMLPATPPSATGTPAYFEGTTSVPVEHSGLWHPATAHGRMVTKGETLGELRDYSGALVETVVAPVSGFALYGLAGPPVRAGESVMTIATPVDTLK
ncbi:MAG: succinylglutamate desuccinylase/aspartoacylase family protein [Pseudomonadota bacterium]